MKIGRVLSAIKIRQVLSTVAVLGGLAGAGFGVYRFTTVQAAQSLPTSPVRKGEFLVTVRCRGELKARRTVQITAPLNVPELRIVWMAAAGSAVKEGDPVVRFDPSSTKQQMDEKSAALKQAEAALNQAEAEGRLQLEQDKRDLTEAQYLLEKAKIEVSKAEIVSRLQGEESRVDQGLAEQKLAVQTAKLKFNEASNAAKVASLKRQRDKAADDVELAKGRLGRMEVKAPIVGVVNFLQNFSQGWMNAKPFKVGDQVWPGSVLGEIPDLATLEMEGKIEEIDRGQMSVDQETRVRIDSLPETTFAANLVQLSPLTEMGWEWPPSRSFRGYAKIKEPGTKLLPGMNGRMDVVLRRIPNALSIPAKAIFTRNGKPIVYVSRKGVYEPVEVEVEARNPDEVAVKGLAVGTLVATEEPEKKAAT
ncbi:MAG TPA: HlyD family efflux transporter periplasmic adaptor subunit [Bryobacteraceae bacterium]|nr:HlyD family efflux transporter periplasmic adaptor subunit [Bryobacteraceae bacterium]